MKTLLGEINPDFLELLPWLEAKIIKLNQSIPAEKRELYSEKDTMLITYADQFSDNKQSNIQVLNQFLETDLEGLISIVHLLPFCPSTSDDGFAPKNYHEVDSAFGNWQDIEAIRPAKMFDCVFNHLSSESDFFQLALTGDKTAEAMFHVVSESEYSSDDFQRQIGLVVRPRTSDLFHAFQMAGETKYVWTTFSKDQVDTNLANLEMFKYVLESFFLYIEKGARYFRIDAVPFLWKDWGTNCSHHEKTHKLVQIFRALTELIHINLYIVTESNVPHEENITYWGNGSNEAHIIYNFSLAPLLLHALHFENNQYINGWAEDVFQIDKQTTYLNFTATHDGIGMRGLEGIVPDEDVKLMCERAESLGGQIGLKRSRDGTVRPYELNITWATYLQKSGISKEDYIKKVIHSHAIVMFFPGIGAHYVHNFLATANWQEGFAASGIARRLNRQKTSYPIVHSDVSIEVLEGLKKLIKYKSKHKAFSPIADFKMLDLDSRVIAFERNHDDEKISVFFNLSSDMVELKHAGASLKLAAYDLLFR